MPKTSPIGFHRTPTYDRQTDLQRDRQTQGHSYSVARVLATSPICSAVSVEHGLMTDRQTDRQTDGQTETPGHC